jgi:hypothetical protein
MTAEPADAQIILGLLDDLLPLGLVPDFTRESPAFASALGAEQGYVLDASPERAVLAAHTPTGLRHAAATLLQLAGGDGSVPCGRIEDWPDFRFRVADWLLNVEINRWGYECGDGRDAVFARMCRKLDLAARHKLNVIWFDGFGWDPDRRSGYAEFARELSRYARSLGIRLAHSGYGGGYGFAYQASDIYTGDYMGRAFENRRPWPDGEVYPCLGHPGYERSWTWGTCLSNAGLLAAKLDELTNFVRACEPGLLYVHDIDTGDWGATAQAWQRRCDDCQRRWPNDEVTAADGMAGAYAHWFRMVVDAVSAACSDARDCEVVFIGPIYTGAHEPDEVWQDECRYFEALSRLIGPAANLQFGIREQFASDREPHLRVAELSGLLDSVGNGHGVLVVSFAGGDSYYSDQLVAPSATLARHFIGAATCYVVHNGGAVEPAQLVAAEYSWHADAPGAAGGVIERACEHLYGPAAGAHLAELFQSGAGVESPVVMVWRTITAEVAKLREGQDEESLERDTFWYDRAEATRRALELVAHALQAGGLSPEVAGDLRWLQATLQIGEQFAAGLAMIHELQAGGPEELRTLVREHWSALERRIREDFPTDTFDPVGGDVGLWLPTLAALAEIAAAWRGGPPRPPVPSP